MIAIRQSHADIFPFLKNNALIPWMIGMIEARTLGAVLAPLEPSP